MNDYSSVFVCLMGMGTVFFGLICLIVLTTIMGRLCGLGKKTAPAAPAVPVPAAAPAVDQQELVAAVAAALAEELGTDITGIRILSMKKL
ncbi:OadG family protein [uncultured Dysosmobacter sp.]|uniref:OadG family protein n=1 Tax=uncultured Dysosmobacter sp. TaxID=2591384 RepID=UPI002624DE93|nr:OadG family protein [uncultured Dysosmobacter sp.]